jgi:hypothetical protein
VRRRLELLADGLDDAAVWRQASDLDLDGLELGVYDAAVELAPARLAALRALGLPVRGVLLSLPAERWPGGALSGDLDRLTDQVAACAQACRDLGVGVLGLWPGADPVGADVRPGLRRVVAAADGLPVALEPKPDTPSPRPPTRWRCARPSTVSACCSTPVTRTPAARTRRAPSPRQASGCCTCTSVTRPGGGDDDLPCGRLHDFSSVVAALDATGFTGTSTFDLYAPCRAAR